MRLGFRHDHRKFAISVALLSVFVVLQVHRARPLVPPRLFRSRTLVAANVGMLLAGAGMFATFFFLTLYMQEVLRFSPLRAGVGYLPISAMIISSAALASKTLGRVGPRLILTAGFLLAASGLVHADDRGTGPNRRRHRSP